MSDRSWTDATAAELREAFDAAFMRRREGDRDEGVPLLAIRVGGEPMAIRVLETAGLLPARTLVAVPSRRAELLGIAGVRGAVVPVYSLARLLGRPDDGPPRWIVLAAAAEGERIGLGVAAFDRHRIARGAELGPAAAGGVAGAHVSEVLHADGAVVPVVSVPSLVRAVTVR